MECNRLPRVAAALALVAMLLLALLPAVGRMQAVASPGTYASHAMHQDPAGRDQPSDAEDCDYCLIQAGADVPDVPALALAVPAGARLPIARGRTHRTRALATGLGSRGPPRMRAA
jgi:hypothetical protein